ncbi:CsbD family protein [soil metagenome]
MNNDTLQGKWKQLSGSIKEAFGKLTDDDFTQAEGSTDKMLGALQERYGYTKDQAEHEWTHFLNKFGDKADDTKDV